MAKTVRRLGRGLDSLISRPPAHIESNREPAQDDSTSSTAIPGPVGTGGDPPTSSAMVDIESLRRNPYQPREHINDADIISLAKSLKRSGFIQPITVRPVERGYEIIAGERRWLAARSIGFSHVPVMIRGATDAEMIELALIENIQREDLNAIERATAYKRFCQEFDLSADEVAQRVGEDRSTVVNYIRLLELAPEVRAMVAGGSLAMGHARCLLGVSDDQRRLHLARAAVRNQLSVRALEEIVRQEKKRSSDGSLQAAPPPRQKSAHVSVMERRFEEQLKTKVVIEEGKRKGTGRIIIEYYSLDDFDRICDSVDVKVG